MTLLGQSSPLLTLQQLVAAIGKRRSNVLATVLSAQGSTPVKAGAKAVIGPGGAIRGTIGGGAVEAEAQRRAIVAIRQKQPSVFECELQGVDADDPSPVCGGVMRVLLDPAFAQHQGAFSEAANAQAQRRRGVLLTAIMPGTPASVTVGWMGEQRVSAALAKVAGLFSLAVQPGAAESQGAQLLAAVQGAWTTGAAVLNSFPMLDSPSKVELLIEPIALNPRLVIVGGGHVGQALARQASLVGFELLVIDDRPEFTQSKLFPAGTVTRCGAVTRELARLQVDSETYIALMTRGHRHDADALAECIRKPARYVGMIGSQRKVALLRKRFIDSGRATAAEFDRVFAPIGLDIGAVTVPEIAASIVAELIAVRRNAAIAQPPLA